MRICASISRAADLAYASDADMVEIRLDLLDRVPDTGGMETIVTFRNGFDASLLPEGFNGYADVGEGPLPDTGIRIISSHHDFEGTPSSADIVGRLSRMGSDIAKGAYSVRDFRDLANILTASESLEREHVLLGMGPLGMITRIRQSVLGNSFTFAYVGEPTAPGQLSLEEMRALGENCMITGIVGYPLGRSMSPAMHTAAYRESGIRGKYLAFPSPSLDLIEECIRGYGIRGLNVTVPYKTAMIGHLDRLSGDAEEAGAVNTVVNNSGVLRGHNTDIDGVIGAFEEADCEIEGMRALIMGSGGAARACAAAMMREGAEVTVTGRNRDSLSGIASDMGIGTVPHGTADISDYDIIANATPIGMYAEGEYPADVRHLSERHIVFDMVYGARTGLIDAAESKKCRIVSGEDMLAVQGARSFELWTGRGEMFRVMRDEL